MATKVDSVISANSEKMPMFTYLGIGSAVLSFIAALMDPSSLRGVIMLLGYAGGAVAMYYVYDSLKKGMVNLPVPCTALSQWCSYGVLASNGLAILAVLMAWNTLNASTASGAVNSAMSAGALLLLSGLVSIVYAVLYIILGVKLINNYEGKLKTLGITFIAVPAIMIVGACFGISAGKGILIFLGLLSLACNGFLFYMAHDVITGKKLF